MASRRSDNGWNAGAETPGYPYGGSLDASEYSRDRYGSGGVKRAGQKRRSKQPTNMPVVPASDRAASHVAEMPTGYSTDVMPAVPPASRAAFDEASMPAASSAQRQAFDEALAAVGPSTDVMPAIGQADFAGRTNVASGVGSHAAPGSGAGAHASGSGLHTARATGDFHRPSTEEVYPEIARVRKRNRRVKRVLVVVGCVLLALVLAGGAYAAWFFSSLDSALAPDEATRDKLDEVLVPTLSGEPFYMLLLGSDSREGSWSPIESERNDEHSDVMILARIDPKAKKVTLLSIPRDTPHKFADGSIGKLNEVYNTDGVTGVIKAVSDLTGANISHYAEVHVSGLEAVVDLLGGVTVDVPIKLSYVTTDNVDITVEAGRQKLNGQQAQIFARARHDYETEQDVHRQDAVRTLLVAIIQETLNRPLPQIPGIVLQEAQYVDTDLKSGDLISLATSFSSGDMTIYTGTGPTDGDNCPAADNQWLCFENPEGWKEVMRAVDAGEDPSGINFSQTSVPWEESTLAGGNSGNAESSEGAE